MIGLRPQNRRRGNKQNTNGSRQVSVRRGPRRSDPDSFSNNQGRYEHYMSLAREAASSGDLIEAENFYQHAEHYLRKMQD
ncbi:MAG: DUF4167 domain-containing protein [Pseudomonadota bacterium]